MVIGERERGGGGRGERRREREREGEIVQRGPYIIRRRRLLEFDVWYQIEPNVYRNAIDLARIDGI